MENRSLGRARLSVPVVGLGTWRRLEAAAAGGQEQEGAAQLDRAVDWYGGRVDLMQIHNLVAWNAQLPMLMRPLGEGQLVRRQPKAADLEPLRPVGSPPWFGPDERQYVLRLAATR